MPESFIHRRIDRQAMTMRMGGGRSTCHCGHKLPSVCSRAIKRKGNQMGWRFLSSQSHGKLDGTLKTIIERFPPLQERQAVTDRVDPMPSRPALAFTRLYRPQQSGMYILPDNVVAWTEFTDGVLRAVYEEPGGR
jgi:hypothetical protein